MYTITKSNNYYFIFKANKPVYITSTFNKALSIITKGV